MAVVPNPWASGLYGNQAEGSLPELRPLFPPAPGWWWWEDGGELAPDVKKVGDHWAMG